MSLIKQRFKGFRCEWDKSNFNTGNTTTVLLTSVSFNNVNKLSLVKLRSFSNYFRVAFAQYYSQQFINYFLQDKYLNNDERTKHRKTKHTFWFLPLPPHPYPPSSYNPLRLPEPSTECYFQNSEKSEFISYLQDPPAVYS